MQLCDLPDEVYVKIFRYLNVKDLKNVVASCKVFNNLILGNKILNRKFVLKITPFIFSNSEPEQWSEVFERSTRTFNQVIVSGEVNNATAEVARKFGKETEKLFLQRILAPTVRYTMLLSQFPALSEIEIDSCGTMNTMDIRSEKTEADLFELKTLKIKSPPFGITFLDMFKTANNLRKLECVGNFLGFVKFLKIQNKLRYLTLHDRYESNNVFDDSEWELSMVDFKLTELDFSSEIEEADEMYMKNLLKFLESQDQLTKVKFAYDKCDDRKRIKEIVEFILKMENLEHVEVHLPSNLNLSIDFCNKSVKAFRFDLFSLDRSFIDNIYKIFPNLKAFQCI
jgi:hypothetical protein